MTEKKNISNAELLQFLDKKFEKIDQRFEKIEQAIERNAQAIKVVQQDIKDIKSCPTIQRELNQR